ncbi:MAG: YraN family protein [Rhizobiaceae bacterium]
MKPDRKKAYRKGKRAEMFAALALRLKGYRIAAKRFKTPVGEVDLIARKGKVVVFVEVKARSTVSATLDSVGPSAMKRIEAAGNWWLSQQPDAADLNWRFDIVSVVPGKWPIHHKNVW